MRLFLSLFVFFIKLHITPHHVQLHCSNLFDIQLWCDPKALKYENFGTFLLDPRLDVYFNTLLVLNREYQPFYSFSRCLLFRYREIEAQYRTTNKRGETKRLPKLAVFIELWSRNTLL